MFAPMLTTRTIRKPGLFALALSGLLLLAPAPAWAQAKNVICNGCVDSVDIHDGTVSADDIGTGAVGSDEIANGAVRSVDILDKSVTGTDIADVAVTSANIADGAVGGAAILDKSVTGADIADNAVTSAHIAPGAVTNAGLALNAVHSGNIADGSVTTVDLAPDVFAAYAASGSGSIVTPGSIVIPAAAFVPDSDRRPFSFSIAGGYIVPGTVSESTCVAAPVQLPNGVTILAFQGIFYDNTQDALVGLSLFEVSLYGWSLSTGAVSPGCDETYHDDPWESPCETPSPAPAPAPTPTTLAHVTTSLEGMEDALTLDTAVLGATVDSVNNAYYVGECFASDGVNVDNTRLYGARIYYQ